MNLRLIQVLNQRQRGFSGECRRQSLALRGDAQERTVLDQIEATADLTGWR